MRLTMPKPTTRDDSSLVQFRLKVPVDLREKAKGRMVFVELAAMAADPAVTVTSRIGDCVKFSLRTRDPQIAKARHGAALAHVNRVFDGMRCGPKPLNLRQIVALSGDVFRLFMDECGDEPGEPDAWTALKGFNRAVREGRIKVAPALQPDPRRANELDLARELFGVDLTQGIDGHATGAPQVDALEARFGILASWTLMKQGIEVTADDRVRLLHAIERATTDAALVLKRHARMDFSPMPEIEMRFPAFHRPEPPKPSLTLSDIMARWQAETRPAKSTVENWTGVLKRFRAFAGHEDARRITPDLVISYKDHLITSGVVSPATIKNTHFPTLKRMFSYAIENRMLQDNPVSGIKIAEKQRAGETRLAYTDHEVARLLALAEKQDNPLRRWVPLLAALTGARVGELLQMWTDHVTTKDGVPCIEIRPSRDGGSLKNASSERVVPLHPAIIEAGFLDFVQSKGDEPLFYRPGTGKLKCAHPAVAHRIRLSAWIRKNGFDDPRKSPNHALRHWFKSTCHRVGVSDSTANAVQGHADPTEASVYRHIDIRTMAEAVARVPVPCVGR